MRPTAAEVMDTIIWTFDQEIAPHVPGDMPKSLANTMSNLLRHVRLRMELEGPSLRADNADLRDVLAGIATYAAAALTLEGLAGELSATLATTPAASPEDASIDAQTREAVRLREALAGAQSALQDARDDLGHDPDYLAQRTAIRDYLDRQLTREGAWIQPAFTGPRR